MAALRNIEATPEQISHALDPLRDWSDGVLAAFSEQMRKRFPNDRAGGNIADDVAVALERLVALRER